MELKKLTNSTYYIENPTNIGLIKTSGDEVYLIDSGNDDEAGKKILKIVDENGWKVKGIISTHSNADHIGGNSLIQKRTDAKIYAHGIERSFSLYPELESAFLFGGYPFKKLKNKFLCAKPSIVLPIEDIPIKSIEYFPLRGHFFDQIGIKTEDDVYFIGDSLFSEETISKYRIFYIYDIKEFLNTLDYLETLKGKYFVPSHAPVTSDLKSLVALNRRAVLETISLLEKILTKERTFEEIVKCVFDEYELVMNENQYVLLSSTIKSYLSYLTDEDKIEYIFKDNVMNWKLKGEGTC